MVILITHRAVGDHAVQRKMNISSFNMVAQEIRDTYDRIWNDWFKGHGCQQAELEIVINEIEAPRYSSSRNLIYLPLCDEDVSNYEKITSCVMFAEYEKWRVWKQDLIHEMLHEYEDKILKQPSADGIRIRNGHRMPWYPKEKHGELFYTAIAEKAHYFELEQEEFRDRL